MAYFFVKIVPPRTTFDADMTEAENAKMREHFGYWSELAEQRTAVTFGPVFDPEGIFGMGILEVDTQERARELADADPAVASGLVKAIVVPMRVGAERPAPSAP